ncbi:hypothetical protein BDP27DRAFT_36560 [Rhodocollybia butyracea]|uniref:Uncharacterized protein n=1 Tax=Rhodocollybia butyracea TaxID=206335 RepID=A0A9P5PZ75_9AGAR|nr:hypothetical protein BDP27DRAFT_36560 [Rhodocollybia butyracea]
MNNLEQKNSQKKYGQQKGDIYVELEEYRANINQQNSFSFPMSMSIQNHKHEHAFDSDSHNYAETMPSSRSHDPTSSSYDAFSSLSLEPMHAIRSASHETLVASGNSAYILLLSRTQQAEQYLAKERSMNDTLTSIIRSPNNAISNLLLSSSRTGLPTTLSSAHLHNLLTSLCCPTYLKRITQTLTPGTNPTTQNHSINRWVFLTDELEDERISTYLQDSRLLLKLIGRQGTT